MSGRLRDSSGRFANGFARTVDTIARSGSDRHQRILLDDTEPLSWMGDPEPARADDKYLYAAAIRGSVSWLAGEPPERHIEVDYVDPAREHIVSREVPGRLGCTDGRVHIAAVEWDAVPRRIAVAPGERRALDADEDRHAAYGDVLRAHEAVLGR